ncbi:MAG: HAMP domain-containing histidine kinase [Gammaproteobacteria bacterium]|nr:HAMP domain-containing histidine kinase [Gammaproteobacteria bacterium]MDH5594117.1 HAMP domain-containing histidine kinase [Gammaproteobacteria bacterium]MDH5613970.1 HAMP domain-containing histidine kinase [Gammaproteobacteria bacterium]
MKDSQSGNSHSLDITTLLASSIHDIKNSLNILLADVDGISDLLNPDDSTHQKALLGLKSTTRRLNNELTQLLVLYRIKTNTYKTSSVFMDVSGFIDDKQREYRSFLEADNLVLKTECADGLYWNFDPMLVTSAINNAINNAQRFAKTQIILSATEVDGMLCIQVQDDGTGFPEKILQGDMNNGPDLTAGGTGIGIYFCHEIASSHCKEDQCGKLEMTNDGPDGGATIRFYFP